MNLYTYTYINSDIDTYSDLYTFIVKDMEIDKYYMKNNKTNLKKKIKVLKK